MFRKILSALLVLTVSGLAHAQVTISNLPPARTPLQGVDAMIVNQVVSGQKTTRQSPLSNLAPFFPSLTSHYLLQAPDATLTQSRTLAGTANQVILTDGGALGNMTLSLPQSIAVTNSPTFAGLTLTGGLTGTSGSFSGALSSVGYSGTTGVFTGALSALSLTLTNPLPATSGGTGFGSYTIGDVLAADSATTLSRLADVSAGSYFRSGGAATLPAWSVLKLPNAAVQGDLLVATSANTIGTLADVAAGSYVRSTGVGATPVYSTTTIPNTSVLGDIWYGSAANVVSALAGNITTGKQWRSQTGLGAVSAAPVWSALPGSFSGFANPSATIGLAAVNGVATTCMASDSAPPLSQAIVPTWTGLHTFLQNVNSASNSAVFQNSNTGTAAVARIVIANSANSLAFANSSTAFSGSVIVGGTTGESADIWTTGAIPLNVGVGGSARISMNNAASGRQVDMVGTTATSAAVAYAGILDQAGVRYGYWGKSSSGSLVSYESDADVSLIGNNGTDSLNISTLHKLAFNGVDMTPTTTTVTWSFQVANSNCSVSGTDATVKLYKFGSVITARLTSTGTCTSAAVSSLATTNAPVPVAFRPANLSFTACITGNGSIPGLCGVNTAGQFITSLGTGTSTTWSLGSGTTFTYTID